MDKIKKSFEKVKQDIDFLNNEINILKEEMSEILEILIKITPKLKKTPSNHLISTSTQEPQNPTSSTYSSTHNDAFKPLKPQNLSISTGNQGASTDRQTDRQTNRHTPISHGKHEKYLQKSSQEEEITSQEFFPGKNNSIDDAAKILDSLDDLKKEIRLKFKRLTEQEILVFSTLYQIDDERGFADYKTISEKLNLTESSIRDYIGRLIKKGIPVEKKRIDNKFIRLKVSENLKKIASLSTILQLRDI